jgi:PilZ domain
MGLQKSFGRLGNRATARLATGLDVTVLLPGRTSRAQLENISRRGCRLHFEEPPRIGVTAIVKIDRTEALGTIKWVRGQRCGVYFDDLLSLQQVERIRWMVEHLHDHEAAKMSSASAVWR